MKYFILVCSFLFASASFGQQIIKAEYFFDTDPGLGKAININVTADSAISIGNLPVSSAGLSKGYHWLYVRTKNSNGIWGHYRRQRFYIYDNGIIRPVNDSTVLTTAEYWIDSPPVPGTGNLITLKPADTLYYFDAIQGFVVDSNCHTVAIRAKDSQGFWSFIKYGINAPLASFDYYVSGKDVIFANQSNNHQTGLWNFADGRTSSQFNIVHHYDSAGVYNVCLTESNACQPQSNTVCKAVAIKGIKSISPNKGGKIGVVTLTITGALFNNRTTVQLRDTLGNILTPIDSSTVVTNGTKILTVFDLKGVEIGLWDIVVNVPGDTVFTVTGGFQIETGTPPQFNVDLVGPSTIRRSSWNNYSLSVENKGNVDGFLIPVWFAIPSELAIKLKFRFDPPDSNLISVNWDTIPVFFSTDTLFGLPGNYKIFGFTIPYVAGNSSTFLDFSLYSPNNGNKFIYSWTNKSIAFSDSSLQYLRSTSACYANEHGYDCLAGVLSVSLPCLGTAIVTSTGIIKNLICHGYRGVWNKSTAWDIINAAAYCGTPITAALGALSSLAKVFASCFGPTFPDPSIPGINVIAASDPNNKYGTQSVYGAPYLNSSKQLNYILKFENVDTATAPAQTVFIADTLNKTNLDLSTFQLSQIGFGDTIISVPHGRKSFTVDIDLQPSIPLIARAAAYLNDSTGVVIFSLISLDPKTMQPTDNALLGILPPNDSTGRGEGFASYSIKAKGNIASGTVLNNKADIYFDNNAPVTTQTWKNITDDLKPRSRVNTLPPISTSDSVLVSWAGYDNGPAGVYAYNVFYNINGGQWLLWKYNTSLTTDTFVGVLGSTYGFYSVAIDSALNIEDKPQTADATTTIGRVLPLNLLAFVAGKEGKHNILSWRTSQENHAGYFDIQRSNDGRDYNAIGKINAGLSNYLFTDNNPPNAINYYRLKIMDMDGRFTYSPVRSVNNSNQSLALSPNPVVDKKLHLQFTNAVAGAFKVELYSVEGKLLFSKALAINSGSSNQVVNLPAAIGSGSYIVKLWSANEVNVLQQLVFVK